MGCKDLCRNCKRGGAVTCVNTHVGRARDWATGIEEMEVRSGLNRPSARERAERRLRLPPGTLYALRYRPPKQIAAGLYEQLRQAWITACERERKALEHQVELARAAGLDVDHPALRAAQTALGDEEG